jgi:hypothetical protein
MELHLPSIPYSVNFRYWMKDCMLWELAHEKLEKHDTKLSLFEEAALLEQIFII